MGWQNAEESLHCHHYTLKKAKSKHFLQCKQNSSTWDRVQSSSEPECLGGAVLIRMDGLK